MAVQCQKQSRPDTSWKSRLQAGADEDNCPDGLESVLMAQSKTFRDRNPNMLVKSQVTEMDVKSILRPCVKCLKKWPWGRHRHCYQRFIEKFGKPRNVSSKRFSKNTVFYTT